MVHLHSRKRSLSTLFISAILSGLLLVSGCFGHHGRLRGPDPLAWVWAAIVTTAIVSSIAPPAPRVVYAPAPRPGYEWQPGYWTREGDDWQWIDGQWIQLPPHYQWAPTHWEQTPDGSWQLIPGRWIPAR